ncbi:hypothetical protein IAR50_004954 [Cryptococcus sp. DSM 104548]
MKCCASSVELDIQAHDGHAPYPPQPPRPSPSFSFDALPSVDIIEAQRAGSEHHALGIIEGERARTPPADRKVSPSSNSEEDESEK